MYRSIFFRICGQFRGLSTIYMSILWCLSTIHRSIFGVHHRSTGEFWRPSTICRSIFRSVYDLRVYLFGTVYDLQVTFSVSIYRSDLGLFTIYKSNLGQFTMYMSVFRGPSTIYMSVFRGPSTIYRSIWDHLRSSGQFSSMRQQRR